MKIIMALAGLDIGGAETHVVELSKELKRRGHEVIIISGGGVYADEAVAFGIKHYTVPVKRRNYIDIVKSMFMIKKIIQDEKPDIVHSHARIPSFIIGEIHRMMRRSFVYVTTVHLDFDTSPIIKKLSRWGEKTLAVSRDLIDYLEENYKVSRKNVYTSINGIDSGKFSEDVSGDRIIEELGLNPNAKRIVYVSRLEKELCIPAYAMLSRMEKLDSLIPGIELVIVGGGGAFDEIKDIADSVNTKLSRRAVVLAGRRTDINEIHASADVCVGVSRAILEPMSMKKPCVIAGHQGYIGILDETNLPTAIETNFTCRGCALTDADTLLEDILTLFGMDGDTLTKTAQFGRDVVREYYSVERMAKDNEKMYTDAIRDHIPNTVMVGYYGYGNRGDDALLCAIIEDMRKESPDFCPVVLSKNPEQTSFDYGVRSINRFNIFKVRSAMKNARLFIAGGGSLIQDVTSTRSLMYYLYCLRLAKKTVPRVMLYANGMGPLSKKRNIEKSAKVLNTLDCITLRDGASAEFLKEIGVTKPDISVTGDPAFSLCKYNSAKADKILADLGTDGKILAVSVRCVADAHGFAESFAYITQKICEKHNLTAVFVPMQYSKDKKLSMDIVSKIGDRAVFIDEDLDVETIMGIVAKSEAVFAVRLHMLLFGAVMGVPVLGINYDPKVKSNIDELGIGQCLDISELTEESGMAKADAVFSNAQTIREALPEKIEQRRIQALQNAIIASELLRK